MEIEETQRMMSRSLMLKTNTLKRVQDHTGFSQQQENATNSMGSGNTGLYHSFILNHKIWLLNPCFKQQTFSCFSALTGPGGAQPLGTHRLLVCSNFLPHLLGLYLTLLSASSFSYCLVSILFYSNIPTYHKTDSIVLHFNYLGEILKEALKELLVLSTETLKGPWYRAEKSAFDCSAYPARLEWLKQGQSCKRNVFITYLLISRDSVPYTVSITFWINYSHLHSSN